MISIEWTCKLCLRKATFSDTADMIVFDEEHRCSGAIVLRDAATKLRKMAAAALKDLRGSEYYNHDPATFANGINNACGGEAAELAAMFNPDVAVLFAELLEESAGHWDAVRTAGATPPGPAALAVARALTGGAS